MAKLYSQTFHKDFARPIGEIWPVLADTQRFNEGAGLPKHEIEEVPQDDGSIRFFGSARMGPFALHWEDFPVEWVEHKWFRHLRVFDKGPLAMLCATATIVTADENSCTCEYLVEARAANLIGEIILRTGFFPSVERDFLNLMGEAEDWAQKKHDTGGNDPFIYSTIEPYVQSPQEKESADHAVARIEATKYGNGLAARLRDWIVSAGELDVFRLRPLQLAQQWNVPSRQVIELCLQATKDGLLTSSWDLLCPRCRGAKVSTAELRDLPTDGHCNACNISYDRNFSQNVELTFRPAPGIRPVDDGEYCLFGPMSTPHVQLQVRLEPGDKKEVPAHLRDIPYRLRTLEIGGQFDFDGTPGSAFSAKVGDQEVSATQFEERSTLELENAGNSVRTVVLEDRSWVSDCLTADQVISLQAFRDLFSSSVLRPGDQVEITRIALMFTDLRGSTELYERVGDAVAYEMVRDHFEFLSEIVRAHDGAVVKTIGDAVMAAFATSSSAAACALEIQRKVDGFNRASAYEALTIKLGLHSGPTIAVTLNDRLDYFGTTVNMAARLQGQSVGGDIVVSPAIMADCEIGVFGITDLPEPETKRIKGFDAPVVFYRLTGPFSEI